MMKDRIFSQREKIKRRKWIYFPNFRVASSRAFFPFRFEEEEVRVSRV